MTLIGRSLPPNLPYFRFFNVRITPDKSHLTVTQQDTSVSCLTDATGSAPKFH
jgi:hypothetical protein